MPLQLQLMIMIISVFFSAFSFLIIKAYVGHSIDKVTPVIVLLVLVTPVFVTMVVHLAVVANVSPEAITILNAMNVARDNGGI